MQLNETVLANNEFIQYLRSMQRNVFQGKDLSTVKHAYNEMTGTGDSTSLQTYYVISFSFAVCLQSRGNENQISLR